MKKFFATYKWLLLYWLIFIVIVFWLAPRQGNYYLESDVRQFRSQHLMPALVWTGVVLTLALLVVLLRQRLPFKQLFLSFFYGAFLLSCFLFILQDVWLGGALWLNRNTKRPVCKKLILLPT